MATYIDPSWGGANSGTKAEPYTGVEAMKVAEGGWSAGETYYWKAGTTDSLTTTQILNQANITLAPYTDAVDGSYGTLARPIISLKGSDLIVLSILINGAGSTIIGLDISGDGIDNVAVPGSPVGRSIYYSSTSATQTSDEHNAIVQDCIIRDSGLQNIRVYASAVTIRNCTIHSAGQDNIFYSGSNDLLIEDNIIYGTGLDGTQADNIQGAANADVNANGDRVIIRRNHCTNDSGIKHCIIGPGVDAASIGGICEDNTIISACQTVINIKGLRTIFRRNTIIASGALHTYIIGATNDKCQAPIVHSNIIVDNMTNIDTAINYNAIIFINSSDGQYYNNTIISNSNLPYLKAIRFNTGTPTGNIARNNTIQGCAQGLAQLLSNNSESNNLFYNVAVPTGTEVEPPVATWTSADGSANSTLLDNDPLLDVDYYPHLDSPCIQAGAWTGAIRLDYGGRPFKRSKPTIGAWEIANRDPTNRTARE